MKEPFLSDDDFLFDVQKRKNSAADRREFHLWWLGQSGFLLQWQGKHLLFDPYLSDSLTKKYAATDKPHVRMTRRVVAPEKLTFIDIVTSSHNHTDHLDAETLIPLFDANPKLTLIIPEANRIFVSNRLNTAVELPLGLDVGRHLQVHGFNFHGIPAAHETIDHDDEGRCKCLGYVVEFGGWTVYHSGDTVRHAALIETLKQWSIDLALLPINGAAPERHVAGNLSGEEAAQFAAEIHARLVIPCHFEMFEFNTADPEFFARACANAGVNYRVLRQGEAWSSAELPPQK